MLMLCCKFRLIVLCAFHFICTTLPIQPESYKTFLIGLKKVYVNKEVFVGVDLIVSRRANVDGEHSDAARCERQ